MTGSGYGVAMPTLSKGPTAKERRHELRRDIAKADRQGSRDVRERSGGRCECVINDGVWSVRCSNRATQVHHMMGGRGVRGKGLSALSIHKQHLCTRCHQLITGDLYVGKALRRIGGPIPKWTDEYRRVA